MVVGIGDPHEKVAGKGIRRLRDAGCEVIEGVLVETCRQHHKRFLSYHEKKRPYIILKWAESQDGFIAPDKEQRASTPKPFWITNGLSRQRVHQWRNEEQGILVGTKTVLEDNPKLNTRHWIGKHPIRFVLDKDLRIPKNFHVLDSSVKTVVFTEISDDKKHLSHIEYEFLDFSKPLGLQICNALFNHNITSIIIEGGTQTIQTFIDEGLWDEARIFQGSKNFNNGVQSPKLDGRLISKETILSDTLSIYVPN